MILLSKIRKTMATIISHPADINFSRNLPEFVLSSTKDISFELRDGDTVILEQSYTPGPDNLVHIDLRDIVHSRLFFTINEQDFAYEQRGIRRVFSAVIDGAVTVGFTVVRGGVDNLPTTASDFFKSNFLTWQPQVKKVTYYSPEYLTYCPLGSCKLIIEAHYPDGATLTNEYDLNPSVVTTFNMNYARIKALFGNDFPAYYDAYVVDASGARISYIQRYTASSLLSEDEDWILFENSLGGLDTIRAYGAMELTSSHEHNIAEIADEKTEYRIDTERKHKKNTGYLDTRQRRWLLDFFPSQGKYIYTCGLFRRIVVTESEAVYKTNELPSEYTFTFSFADQTPLLYIPRVDTLPPELEIKAPDHGSFTLPPRLIEFPQINLGEGALFPVQAPNSDYWSAVTIGALKEYLGLSGISGTFITREEVVRMINDIDINKVTLEQCEAIVKTISYTKDESDTRYPTYIIDGEVIISADASAVTDINEL